MHCRLVDVCIEGACEGRTGLWLWLWLVRLFAPGSMTLPTWQRIMATLSIPYIEQGIMSKQMRVIVSSDLICCLCCKKMKCTTLQEEEGGGTVTRGGKKHFKLWGSYLCVSKLHLTSKLVFEALRAPNTCKQKTTETVFHRTRTTGTHWHP